MAKRSKQKKREFFKGLTFLDGVNIGTNMISFSMQLQYQVAKKNISIEQFSQEAKVPIEIVKGIIDCNLIIFLNLDIEVLQKLAVYCDVVLDVTFKKESFTFKAADVAIPSFEEEYPHVRIKDEFPDPRSSSLSAKGDI